MQHINPAEAVQIHRDLHAKCSVGVHWGTFNLTDEPLDQPPLDLVAARIAQGVSEDAFFLLKIGETRALSVRPPGWLAGWFKIAALLLPSAPCPPCPTTPAT